MKKLFLAVMLLSSFFIFSSCEKDEGILPDISFKTGGAYTSANAGIVKNSSFTIGINAAKTEKKDVLKKFNISKAVNGGADVSVFSKDLSSGEGDNFSYDFTAIADGTVGQTAKYTFTITNRDGLVNQVSLVITTL